jgi:hypothetical protein
MKAKRWYLVPVLGFALAALAGCGAVVVGAAAGAGAVAYIRGELEATEEAPIDKVVKATKAAIDDLELRLTSSEADAVSAKIKAETARGTDIGISLKRVSDDVTEIHIRVGVFGDEELSRLIHEKMRAHLTTA